MAKKTNMLTEEQNKKRNDIRAKYYQGIYALRSGETLIAEVQTELQKLQEEVGVASPIDTTPAENGTYTKEQADQMIADAIAALETAFIL